MKQERIITAYKLLEKLNKTPGLPFGVCYKLFAAKKALSPFCEAQAEKEKVLFEAAGIDENGNVKNTPELRRALADILKTDVDFKEEPVKVELDAEGFRLLGITAEIIEQLEGFVEFEEVRA